MYRANHLIIKPNILFEGWATVLPSFDFCPSIPTSWSPMTLGIVIRVCLGTFSVHWVQWGNYEALKATLLSTSYINYHHK